MALFEGDELVDITTPDGRTLKLPRSIVPPSLMPQISTTQVPGVLPGPAPIGVPPQAPTQQVPPVPVDVPADDEPASAPIGEVELGEPTTRRVTEAQLAKEQKQAQAKAAKDAQAKAAYNASPKGQMAGAEGQTQGAIGAEKTATIDSANVDAAAQDLMGQATEEHNKRIDALFEKRAADAQTLADEEQKKINEVGALRKKIAGTKIDRSADHPILAAISVALFELGSAMKGDKPGMGIEMLYKALDRKAAAQEADLDQMARVYGFTKDELGELRKKADRKLEFHSALIAAEADKAKRHLEEIIAKSASEKTRANAKILMAQIDQRAAAAHMDAVRWGLDYDQKERAEKNQNNRFYAQLAETKRSNLAGEQLKREDMYLDYQKALAQTRASGDQAAYKAKLEMIKDNETRGLRNTNTGDILLTGEGRRMLEEASKLEEQAKSIRELDAKSFDPNARAMAETRARALEEKASVIRGDAAISYQVRHRDPTQAGKLSDQYSSVQHMTTVVDEIKEIYDDVGKRYLSTNDKQAAIQSKMTELLMDLKNAWQLGVLSKQDTALINQGTGGDPTVGWNLGNIAHIAGLKIGTDPEAFKARLDSLIEGAQNEVTLKMKATNFSGSKKELFERRKPNENSPEAKAVSTISKERTPLEAEESARASGEGVKGTIATGVQKVFYGTSPEEQAQQAAEAPSHMTYLGLTPKQGDAFGTLIQSYKSGNARSGDLIVSQVTNNTTARPKLALATMHNLREHAPDLYAKARAAITSGPLDEQLDYEEKIRIGVSTVPTPELAQQVLMSMGSDAEGKAELARRAAGGDKDATKALRDLVLNKSRADLPAGSVFKEGGR